MTTIHQQVDEASNLMKNMSINNPFDIGLQLYNSLSLNKKQIKPKESCSDTSREYVFNKLFEVLQNEAKSKNLEISIFNWTINFMKNNKIKAKISKKNKTVIVNNNELNWNNNRFKRMYLSKYRSILFNLKNENNKIFKEKVLENVIKTREIVNMKPEEIFPDVWEDVYQNQTKKEMIRLRNEEKEHTCDKCKKINIIKNFMNYKRDLQMNQ